MSDLFSDLQWRGLVYDSTQGAKDLLAREKVTAYSGFDPTASSLHVGHLMQMMGLARLQRAGHSPIALVGGGTGLIGDPSGKTVERTLQSREDVEANVRGIRSQLERFLDFNAPANPARLVDNGEWLNSMSAMEFLRDVGKYFTVNYLLAKESVKRRLESEEGISYTEFSYSLLQAYDFLVLHDRFTCRLQIGGSDQWGNIVAGADLIRKLRGTPAHGVVTPLLMTSSGTKFGKTETGIGMARSGADVAVPLLSVLAQLRGSRCRRVPEVLHVQVAGRDCRARARNAGASRAARRAARARARGDGDGARRRSRRAGRARGVGALRRVAVWAPAPTIS